MIWVDACFQVCDSSSGMLPFIRSVTLAMYVRQAFSLSACAPQRRPSQLSNLVRIFARNEVVAVQQARSNVWGVQLYDDVWLMSTLLIHIYSRRGMLEGCRWRVDEL